VLAVLTKTDKLGRARLLEAQRARAAELGMAPDELLATSGVTGVGISDLGESILEAVKATSPGPPSS
jgi:hypothetical protein